MLIALFTGFVAKENTIATLGVLYGDIGNTLPALLSGPAALGFLIVQMLFIPVSPPSPPSGKKRARGAGRSSVWG
jgi:Fe2+ transport system protein B